MAWPSKRQWQRQWEIHLENRVILETIDQRKANTSGQGHGKFWKLILFWRLSSTSALFPGWHSQELHRLHIWKFALYTLPQTFICNWFGSKKQKILLESRLRVTSQLVGHYQRHRWCCCRKCLQNLCHWICPKTWHYIFTHVTTVSYLQFIKIREKKVRQAF